MNWRELFHRLFCEDPSWLHPPRSPRLRVSFGSCLRQLFKHRIKAQLGRLLTHRRSLQLKGALRLPMFTVGRMELFKRLTLIAEDGRIKRVFYPVFSPDRNADDVLACLRSGAQQ